MSLFNEVGICMISACLLVASGPARAEEPKADDYIKYRQSVMRSMGWNFKALTAIAKGEKPFEKDEFARRSAYLEIMSKMPLEGFAPGTENSLETETRAKPEIWAEYDKFSARLEKLQADTAKLAEVTRTGDEALIKARFGDVSKSCKGCHEVYRAK